MLYISYVKFAILYKRIGVSLTLGSLRNHNGDAEDNVDQKTSLYFTCESRGTLKSFTLFITVETIAKINPEHSDKFDIKI